MKVKTTRKNRKPAYNADAVFIPPEKATKVIAEKPAREKITYQEFCKRLLKARIKPYDVQFCDLDLSDMNLANLDLTGIHFNNVDFTRTSFHYAKLYRASFYACTLTRAEFRMSNLTSASFQFCLLEDTSFWYTDMERVSINQCTAKNARRRTGFEGQTSFYNCNLYGSEFYGNHIKNASFYGSPMNGATLSSNDFINPKHFVPLVCPSHGSFTAFKKVLTKEGRPIIAKLTIPARAQRSSSTGRKCRASEAKVMGFYDYEGKRLSKEIVPYACSTYTKRFRYYVGKTVYPKNSFDKDRWEECAGGIHFFITFQEAVEYNT